jgi:hypothetical protein
MFPNLANLIRTQLLIKSSCILVKFFCESLATETNAFTYLGYLGQWTKISDGFVEQMLMHPWL